MKTYVNTSLIDALNAQMQLSSGRSSPTSSRCLGGLWKVLACLRSSIATLMIGFGIMMWLMMPPAVAPADEYITTYEISEVNIKGNASDSDIPGNGFASISDSLSEIQNNLSMWILKQVRVL